MHVGVRLGRLCGGRMRLWEEETDPDSDGTMHPTRDVRTIVWRLGDENRGRSVPGCSLIR